MINNIFLIVIFVVIFRIIFEILFFSKSTKESFTKKIKKAQKDVKTTTKKVNKNAEDKLIGNDKENVYVDNNVGSWGDLSPDEEEKNINDERKKMNSKCCPNNKYSYKATAIPKTCLKGEDNISCLWREKKPNNIININGDLSFNTINKYIYGSNSLLGGAMNSLEYTTPDIELGWIEGTLTDISSSMLDSNYFWKLFNPNINLKCEAGNGENVVKRAKNTISGNSPYVKSCIKNNVILMNQYEDKNLTEIPCDGMTMDCYYNLFRGSQGFGGIRFGNKTGETGYMKRTINAGSDYGNTEVSYNISSGDWWLKDEYVQKRVLMYNLKSYVGHYNGWDTDLDTAITEIANEMKVKVNINNSSKITFFESIISIWQDPNEIKEINKKLHQKLGRYAFSSDSDGDMNVINSKSSLKFNKYDTYTEGIYDFKLQDSDVTRKNFNLTDSDSDIGMEDFHLFKYDEKIEKLIEDIDTLIINGNMNNSEKKIWAKKMIEVVEDKI